MTEARVGPNAILQTMDALTELGGDGLTRQIFDAAGLRHMLEAPPAEMVPEADACLLHRTVIAHLPRAEADQVAVNAGQRTGQYILENRIPRAARLLLRALPAGWAGPMLLHAIGQHAWTFAGSADVSWSGGCPLRFTIHRNPLAVPGCLWHCAVFETLFRRLVTPKARVTHVSCCAAGDAACVFEIDIRRAA